MHEVEIYEVEEVAEMLKISKATVYKLLQEKKLKSIRIARKYLVTKKAIYEFIYGTTETTH